MLQKRTWFRSFLLAAERHDPSMEVFVIGDLGSVGDELSVRGPVVRKLRTLCIKHALCRSAAHSLAEEAHPPLIAPAKQNFVAIRRPNGSEFRLGNIGVSKTEDGALTYQVHHPDRRQDCARVIVPVQSHVPLVW